MKFTEGTRQVRRRGDVLGTTEAAATWKTPGVDRLRKNWREYVQRYGRWPVEDYEFTGPAPFEHAMNQVFVVATLFPDKLQQLKVGEDKWQQVRKYLDSDQYNPRFDLWLETVRGARVLFPEHADELTSIIRPRLEPVWRFKGEYCEYLYNDFAGIGVLNTYLSDPEFPGLDRLIADRVQALHAQLEKMETSEKSGHSIANVGARLFLFSPSERDVFADKVKAILEASQWIFDFEYKRKEYHATEEPWYSVLLTPQARLKDGRIVFEDDRLVTPVPLPQRPTL